MRRALVVVATALLIVSCGASHPPAGASTPAPRTASASAADRACSRDVDCVLVDDCCGCDTGGQRLAINRTRLAELSSNVDTACASRHCAPAPEPHRSCTATTAHCSGGLCVPVL